MKNTLKLLSALMMLSVLAMPVIAGNQEICNQDGDAADISDKANIDCDTDSTEGNTKVVEVYPAGSEESVTVDTDEADNPDSD